MFSIALVGECESFLLSGEITRVFYLYYFRRKEVTKFSNTKVVNCRAVTLKKGSEPSLNRAASPAVLNCFHHNGRGEDVFSVWIMSGDKILTGVNTAEHMRVFQPENAGRQNADAGAPEGRIP